MQKKLTSPSQASQKGFTLIELVVVIVILGILAVTAAPKFIDLQDDARTATLNGVKAAMQSASTMLHSKSLIVGNEGTTAAAGVLVTVNSIDINTHFGYPLADYTAATATAAGDWTTLLDIATTDFSSVVIATGQLVYYPATVTPAPTLITDTCIVYYTEATSATVIPTFTVVDCV